MNSSITTLFTRAYFQWYFCLTATDPNNLPVWFLSSSMAQNWLVDIYSSIYKESYYDCKYILFLCMKNMTPQQILIRLKKVSKKPNAHCTNQIEKPNKTDIRCVWLSAEFSLDKERISKYILPFLHEVVVQIQRSTKQIYSSKKTRLTFRIFPGICNYNAFLALITLMNYKCWSKTPLQKYWHWGKWGSWGQFNFKAWFSAVTSF